jgi:hypothetical protein
MDFACKGNVSHAQLISGNERLVLQFFVKQGEQRLGGFDRLRDEVVVSFRFGCSNPLNKGNATGPIERGLLPIHPLLSKKTDAQV